VIAEHALRVAWLGDALLMAGRLDEAHAHANEASELARRHGERGAQAWASRLLAAVCEAGGNPAEARDAYEDTLARATELGMRPLVAHAHLGLSRVTAGATAARHGDIAVATYRALGMRLWVATVPK
jgi:ATP/maltotriose-dependent transcriptional regulator MalT